MGIRPLGDSCLDELIECPHCGNVETLDGYDVGGADWDGAFCNHCHLEFVLATAGGSRAETQGRRGNSVRQ